MTPTRTDSVASRPRRWLIIAIVVAVAWVPGAIALAMLLSGNAG